jgi:hypothetical protein
MPYHIQFDRQQEEITDVDSSLISFSIYVFAIGNNSGLYNDKLIVISALYRQDIYQELVGQL